MYDDLTIKYTAELMGKKFINLDTELINNKNDTNLTYILGNIDPLNISKANIEWINSDNKIQSTNYSIETIYSYIYQNIWEIID